jgi:uncharacterized protein YecE (DUF72 family)
MNNSTDINMGKTRNSKLEIRNSPILIGTSGYSYQDWVGPVYPPGTAAKDYLRLYAAEFAFAELNFSYYRQPDPRTIERMLHAVDQRFCFAVKAYKGLTHEVGNNFVAEAARFREGIAPLIEAGRLAAVLLQFPHSFHYSADSRKHLQRLCDEFGGVPAAVEFRDSAWQRDSVYAGLKARGIAYVNVDEPDLPGLPRPSAIVTAHFAYARFHGRNKTNWWTGDNASRYDYSYSDTELAEWLPRLNAMAAAATPVLVAFNNHWRGQAVGNARRLRQMTTEEG